MIKIGTSGWSYPHWHNSVFYPEDISTEEELAYYTTKFDTVELNSSFYHLPKATTFQSWQETTPKDFVFSVKASRYITHNLNLKNAEEPLNKLVQNANSLGKKLGPILFQLSPRFRINFERLKNFLDILPKNQRFAFEFRHQSWFDPKVYGILRTYKGSLVFADTPDYPIVFERTTDFIYTRLHGHTELYKSNYTDTQLKDWADKIKHWEEDGNDVFVYFDNDAEGYAPQNALELRNMLKS